MGKVHHATIGEATESDNQTWVYIDCDPDDRIEDPEYSKNWDYVDCKRCLKKRKSTKKITEK